MTGLEENYKIQLCSWIGRNSEFKRLYKPDVNRQAVKAQRACDIRESIVTAFHRACDNQGPTVTLCSNTSGYVFGGYTSQSWTSDSDIFYSDKNAFLFRLQTPNGLNPKQYRVKPGQEHKAVCSSKSRGPMFGTDFCPFQDEVNVFPGGGFRLGYSGFNIDLEGHGILKLGNTYDMKGDNCHTFCGNNLTFTEIEVFAVRHISSTKPWRKIATSKRQSLSSAIEAYAPPVDSKVKAINLLLLGPIGAGKSSFFNSVTSTFQREITAIARSGSGDRSLTKTYRRYRVRSKDTGEPIKLRLCDTRGFETEGGLDLIDIMAVVEGHVPDRFPFQPTVPINARSTGYNANPSPDEKMHCVGFVIDSTSVDVLPQQHIHLIKSLQQRLNGEGIPQVVILTKPDIVCPEVNTDVSKIFTSEPVRELVDRTSQLFGLPRHCVFPVKNYEQEMEVDEAVDIPILLCLKHVVRYADDYIKDSLCSD